MARGLVDAEKILCAVDAAAPVGPDCEYDPDFQHLERIIEGRPERQIGNVIEEAVPPEWREVLAVADGLLERTKDIRVAQCLCRALLALDGLPGLADGLSVLLGLLERYWPTLHPQLDPDDDDATYRVNIINGLADPVTMLRPVRESVVVSARGLGTFTLREAIAANAGAADGAVDPSLVEAAFANCDLDEFRHVAESAQRALDQARAIESFVTGQVGASYGSNLAALTGLLREASALLAGRLSARGGGVAAAADPAPAATSGMAGGAAPVPAAGGAAPAVRVSGPGVIASSDDVIRTIDSLCAYYAKAEPSSPVPLILQRARRLVGLNFMELLCDLTPDGVSQFETISGRRRDD